MFGRIVGAAVGVMLGAAVSPGPRVGAAVGVTHAPSTAHCPLAHTHTPNPHTALREASQVNGYDRQVPPVNVLQ